MQRRMQSHLSACFRPTPPASTFWPAIAGRCTLLHVHISPVLPCPQGGVLTQLGPQKAALALLVRHPLHTPISESRQMLKLDPNQHCATYYKYISETHGGCRNGCGTIMII